MLWVIFGIGLLAVIVANGFRDTIMAAIKARMTATTTTTTPGATTTATSKKTPADYPWYITYLIATAIMGTALLVFKLSFPYWAAGYEIAGGPPWWVLLLAAVAIIAAAGFTSGKMRSGLLGLNAGLLGLVLVVYLISGLANMPDCLDDPTTCHKTAAVMHYPVPPPSEAGPPARSATCPGTPPIPGNPRRLEPGETQVVNKGKSCGYTFAVIAGNVELDAPEPEIPEKATCMGPEPCKLYDMLCPYGTAPTNGGWKCKGSGGGTTNTYGVTAGVGVQLGVFHSTD